MEFGVPAADEHAPYYAKYIGRVGPDLLAELDRATAEAQREFAARCEASASKPYAPGKWSPKELVGHVADTERAFAFRALCFARQDPAPLPSFDQDLYAAHARFHQRSWEDVLEEFFSVRAATRSLLRSLVPEDLPRRGVASGNPFTVRAVASCIVGHDLHHREVLRERYPGMA